MEAEETEAENSVLFAAGKSVLSCCCLLIDPHFTFASDASLLSPRLRTVQSSLKHSLFRRTLPPPKAGLASSSALLQIPRDLRLPPSSAPGSSRETSAAPRAQRRTRAAEARTRDGREFETRLQPRRGWKWIKCERDSAQHRPEQGAGIQRQSERKQASKLLFRRDSSPRSVRRATFFKKRREGSNRRRRAGREEASAREEEEGRRRSKVCPSLHIPSEGNAILSALLCASASAALSRARSITARASIHPDPEQQRRGFGGSVSPAARGPPPPRLAPSSSSPFATMSRRKQPNPNKVQPGE
ncbi:hypothetical protein WMY93_034222 [Mugilogobius chulae]|uniref:Uncharacterized protein n=1 Tax=Mugilogobius chulae TaxID=88201 RepID=A0AAW0MIM8_9GOBI